MLPLQTVMRNSHSRFRIWLHLAAVAALMLACGSPVAAQQGDLDNLAKNLNQQIRKLGITSVVVVDFVSVGGDTTPEGHYLAGELSQSLEKHKKDFEVRNRAKLAEVLSKAQIQTTALSAQDLLRRVGSSLEAAAVITGAVEETKSVFSITAFLRNTEDGSLLATEHESIERPAIADGMALLAAQMAPGEVFVAGQDGLAAPECLSCAPPGYDDEARRLKLQGSVVMVIIVTTDGHIARSALVRSANPILAKLAAEQVKKWRFKPVAGPEGTPVSVLVPIEVTFHLY